MGVARYWREIPARYNLIGSKCNVCNEIFFPPIKICPNCRRKSIGKIEDYKLKGKGTVESFTIIRNAPPEFEKNVPYAIALIKMEEGCYITGEIVDCEPDEIRIGMKVELCFRRIQQDGNAGAIYYGYKFRKVD